MSHENNQQNPVDALERALARFSPAPPRLDRDRLMFLAGQASALGSPSHGASDKVVLSTQYSVLGTQNASATRRGRWLWPISTAALAATSLGLAVALWLQPQPRMVIVERQLPAPAATEVSPAVESDEFVAVPEPGRREPVVSRLPPDNYLRTREVALRMGLDAIGRQPVGFGQPARTYGDLLLDLSGAKRAADEAQAQSILPFPL